MLTDFLKIHVGQMNFGRRQDITIYCEDENYEHNGLIHVAKPINLEMVQVNVGEESETDPTLKLGTRSLISMFKSFESSMLQNNLISPKVEKTECKNETIEILKAENMKLHEINKQLMEVVKNNV